MDKGKLKWCLRKKRGIELIEPKPHLSKQYMEEAEKTLENVFSTTGKWKVITAYYACYNAVYSLLMECGVKCEIHDCTIEMMDFFSFEEEDIEFIRDLKERRVQAQYYLKEERLENVDQVKDFVSKCQVILDNLSSTKTEKIRKTIEEI